MTRCSMACSGLDWRALAWAQLAAIKSLYASGTLSMKVGGAAGPSLVQQNGVRQGCPLSPTLFGIFLDGLHGHLDCSLLHAGLQLGSGRWVSALVYADDVVLLSWTAAGLQDLLDSMHAFCLSLGLIISPSKTEVVVFNGSSSDMWHVGQHVLPEALARLLQNGKGAAARLSAKHKTLMCEVSFPMMRRLFNAAVRPTVLYGCDVWAPACSLALVPQLKDMQDIQLSFFRNLCESITPHIIFRPFAERPWLDSWWSMVLGFMRRLSLLPEGSVHLDILRDNNADARQPLMCVNWAAGVDKQFRDLGMGSPFVSSGIGALDSHGS